MKRICLSAGVLLTIVCPVLAGFDVGIPETFDKNLDGWLTKGNVYWSNYANNKDGYAGFGDVFTNRDNLMAACFTAPCDGAYDLSFDYRFRGVDLNSAKDDCVNVDILVLDQPRQNVFSAKSSVDLTGGLLEPGEWKTVKTPSGSLQLQENKKYWLCFELKNASSLILPLTFLDIDNISLSKANQAIEASCIPAPGSVILCTLGSIAVGYLKRRKIA
jgi:hypothetical protein